MKGPHTGGPHVTPPLIVPPTRAEKRQALVLLFGTCWCVAGLLIGCMTPFWQTPLRARFSLSTDAFALVMLGLAMLYIVVNIGCIAWLEGEKKRARK